VADSLAHAQLARAAGALHCTAKSRLPPLVLLTDDERLPDPRAAILTLPRGSLVVLRTREASRRIVLATLLVRLAREHELKWIIADDPALAVRMDADGAHFPQAKISLAARWRVRRRDWLITCAAHSLEACCRAARAGADAAFLAPVFATASHPGEPVLGSVLARRIVRAVPLPLYALGGVNAATARQLAGSTFQGLAAIGGLSGFGTQTVAQATGQTYKAAPAGIASAAEGGREKGR
jgi:thiamine-phosphate pyrophosphorylase